MEKKEYIERGALLEKNMYGNTAPITHRTYAQQLINSVPAADVVEVVRCKDCEHAQRQVLKKSGGFEGWVCEFDQEHFAAENHFCSLGIRRQDE